MNNSQILDNPTVWEFGRICLDLFFGLYRKRFNKIKEWGLYNKNYSVIDIGCGIGQYCKITKGNYLGIDLQPNYISYCKRKYKDKNKSFRCADASTILKEKTTFDLILIVDFLHHVSDDLAVKILHTASLLSNEYVVNFEPVYEQSNPIGRWLREHDRGNYIRSLENLHKLFKVAGLEIIESSELILGPSKTRAILAKPIKS